MRYASKGSRLLMASFIKTKWMNDHGRTGLADSYFFSGRLNNITLYDRRRLDKGKDEPPPTVW